MCCVRVYFLLVTIIEIYYMINVVVQITNKMLSQKNPRTCSEDFFIQAKGLAWHQPLGCMESRYACMASPTGVFLWLDSIRHNVSIPYCNKLQIPYNANALIFQSVSIRLVATLCQRQSLHPSKMRSHQAVLGALLSPLARSHPKAFFLTAKEDTTWCPFSCCLFIGTP